MISKQDLVKLGQKEFATTLKVLKSFPSDRKDFRPHERSSDAMKLTSTFVFEMYLLNGYLFGDPIDRSLFQNYKPESLEAVIKDFEKESSHALSRLQDLPEAELGKTIQFGGRSFTGEEFALMMICDQIHHRGQLSVYVRMAGGKVPSIYGPSADDPGTNLQEEKRK